MAQLEIKKMKQGMSYSCKEKTIIMNVFKYFRTESPEVCVTEIVRRTAKATGCSEKSIFQFRKEESSGQGFRVPSTTKIRRNININSRDIKYDASVRQRIKNIIYDLKYKNVTPSLTTLVRSVNSDPNLPNFSLMTLRRLIFDMGFCYEKQGNKSILIEKPPIKKELKQEKSQKKTKSSRQTQVKGAPPPPQPPQNNIPVLPNHNNKNNIPVLPNHHITQQNHMHMPDNNYHMMPPHHNMMMLNRMPMSQPIPPSNVNMNHSITTSNVNLNLRPDMPPPWIQHHTMQHELMKRE